MGIFRKGYEKMRIIRFDRFKGGKRHCLTFSYDDGQVYDRKLVEILNRYEMKGTFHLNSGNLGLDEFICQEEVGELYRGHEVSCHSVSHPFPNRIPLSEWLREVWEDRKKLESLSGDTVRGMSYPFGAYNQSVIEAAKSCGIVYSRTTKATFRFELPYDFMKWHPTCHHHDCMKYADSFFNQWAYENTSRLFYVWGHSFEFERENNWELIENFCKKMSGNDQIWYATNIEVYDYVQNVQRLQITADKKQVYNPSTMELWFSCDGETVSIGGGETVHL